MSNNILRSQSEVDDSTAGPAGGDEQAVESIVDASTAEEAEHRARLYALLALGFDRPEEDLARLIEEGVFVEDVLAAAESLDDEDLVAAASAVADELTGESVDEPVVDIDDLYYEWGSLFGVEEGVTVSQYELTYLPGPLMTNSRDMADIAGFYKAFDLSLAEGENDRKDLLGFQLEFLSHLCLREAYLRREGDDEGVHVVVGARRSFVEDHLGRWFWRFADEVCKYDDGGFYAALTDLLSALVERELELLEVDPDWVPDDPEVIEWNEDVFGDSGRGCGGCGMGEDAAADLSEMGISGDMPAGPPDAPDQPGPSSDP
jgi:TorA maturation chaperone TorD